MRKYLTPTFVKASLLYFMGKLKADPVFIIGTGRCGSSLLVEILQSNKNIKTSQEEYYSTFLEALEDGFSGKEFLTDIIDFEKLMALSLSRRTALKRFYLKVIFKYFVYRESRRYVLKSPAISLQLKELDALFPKATYIHLYRNPFAVTLSLYKKEYFRVERYRKHFSDAEFKQLSANYWNVSMAAIQDFLTEIPATRVMEFSYEAFTENPTKHCSALASFIEVPDEFSYDFSSVRSTNYKMDELTPEERQDLGAVFTDIATSKGYEV